jgi:hypothetical protein
MMTVLLQSAEYIEPSLRLSSQSLPFREGAGFGLKKRRSSFFKVKPSVS